MGLRGIAVFLIVGALSVYAWRNWFVACCGLVILVGVLKHPSMPTNVAGIQGLNPWNLLLVSVFMAWIVNRGNEGLRWDMPPVAAVAGGAFLAVILIGSIRMMIDRSHLGAASVVSLASDQLINTFKWLMPAVILFDGCRTRRRLVGALVSVAMLYMLLAGVLVRRMPPRAATTGGPDIHRIRLKVCSTIGYSVPDMSTVLGGSFWVLMAMTILARRKLHLALLAGAGLMAFYGQLLTGGRAGYLAFIMTGLLMCLLRWRKWLLLAPVVPLAVMVAFPAVIERATAGMFSEIDPMGNVTFDEAMMTSGRVIIWPHVIERIGESPLVGYGRLAMLRTGLRDELWRLYGEAGAFPHPHNIYLEWIFDNGVLGLIPVAILFGWIVWRAAILFRDRTNPWAATAGGAAFALVVTQLVAGLGSQHFYPKISTVGMWVVIALMIRVWVERQRARPAVIPVAS
ncbi:MAG: O-antigen ligase family protein [Planctomycetota bacterium]